MTQDLQTEQSQDVKLLCFSTIEVKVWVFMGGILALPYVSQKVDAGSNLFFWKLWTAKLNT